MGAHYNAFTSEENTVYYAAVLPEHQDRAVALLGDLLAALAPPGGFRHREAGDPGRDPDVRGPAAVRGRRQVPGGLLRRPPAGPQRAGHRRERGGPVGGRDAGVLPAPLQPGQHHPGRCRADRFRRPGGGRRSGLRPLATGRRRAPGRAGPAAIQLPHASPRRRPRSNTSCNWPRGPTPAPRTAMPPSSWPSSWATTPAAGFTGSWSIRAWPSIAS